MERFILQPFGLSIKRHVKLVLAKLKHGDLHNNGDDPASPLPSQASEQLAQRHNKGLKSSELEQDSVDGSPHPSAQTPSLAFCLQFDPNSRQSKFNCFNPKLIY